MMKLLTARMTLTCASLSSAVTLLLFMLTLMKMRAEGFSPSVSTDGRKLCSNHRRLLWSRATTTTTTTSARRSPARRLWVVSHEQTDQHTDLRPNVVDSPKEAESIAATLRSVTFCHLPKDQEPELLCDFLMEIGACAAYLVDADRGTEQEEPLFRPIHIPDQLDNEEEEAKYDPVGAAPAPALPVWNRCNVTAHFPASIDLAAAVELVRDCFPHNLVALASGDDAFEVEQVPNRDWVVHVQQGWKPIVVAQHYVLRFPWHTDHDVAQVLQQFEASADNKPAVSASTSAPTVSNPKTSKHDWVQLQLQGGIAFGTGEHPTTQLCLEWLHQIVSERLLLLADDAEGYTILDYGAGSGILGMAACALDPSRVRAVGVDLDVDACRIANANAVTNGNLPMRNYLPPLMLNNNDHESQSLIMKAHAYARKQQPLVLLDQQDNNNQQQENHLEINNSKTHFFSVERRCHQNILFFLMSHILIILAVLECAVCNIQKPYVRQQCQHLRT